MPRWRNQPIAPRRIESSGWSIWQMARRRAASAELRTAVRLNPGDERTRMALANALVDNEQLDEAEQALNDTLRALPASGRAHYLLGLTYRRQGKRPDAMRELQAALAQKPLLGANTIHQMIGTLQQDEQDLDAAAMSFAARVDLVPNDHDAHRDLGHVVLSCRETMSRRERSSRSHCSSIRETPTP